MAIYAILYYMPNGSRVIVDGGQTRQDVLDHIHDMFLDNGYDPELGHSIQFNETGNEAWIEKTPDGDRGEIEAHIYDLNYLSSGSYIVLHREEVKDAGDKEPESG